MHITSTNGSPLDAGVWNLLETTTEFFMYEPTTDYSDGSIDNDAFYQKANSYTPTADDYLLTVALVLSTMALLYGVVTSIVFPKARNFQNYVSLNALISITLSCSVAEYELYYREITWFDYLSLSFFYYSFLCWLFVGSVIVYRNIVVVFNSRISWKYLVSSVFAWGLPLCSVLFSYWQVDQIYVMYHTFTVLLVLANVYLYGRVLFCLLKGIGVSEPSRKWANIRMATITFFLGGTPIAVISELYSFGLPTTAFELIIIFRSIYFILHIIYSLFYIMLKTNWQLWYEAKVKSSVDTENPYAVTVSETLK